MQDTILVLKDGKSFLGRSVGKKDKCKGEICFTTCVTGYQHTITDPSFADQIITFTFPHIGNIGVNNKENEGGKRIFASGIIIRELSRASHPASYMSLNDWLKKNDIVGISGIDTRCLIRYLQKHQSQIGIICPLNFFPKVWNMGIDKIHVNEMAFTIESLLEELKEYKPPDSREVLNKVSLSNSFKNDTGNQKYKIIIVDFGIKASIVSHLIELGCVVELVKPDRGFAQKILSTNPDGIVFSNGPGNPQEIAEDLILEIDTILKSKIPVFGICMGHQLLAITLGARTFKMKVGHRGSNHPVYNLSNGKIEITSQNHGFVIDPSSIPESVEVTHISLFDRSIEGIKVKNRPVFSVQYHPERAPGTHDSYYIFKNFIKNIESYKFI